MLNIILVILIILTGSAICSCTETALFSVSSVKVKQLAQSKKPQAIALQSIRGKMNRPIATIVIINNIFNIVGSIIIGSLATEVFGDALLGLFSGILTFLIIIFGEIIPKTVGERYAEPIALFAAIPIQFLTVVFTPIVWLMEQITSPFTKGKKLPTTNEAEIRFLTMIGYKEGVIEGDEAEMIHRVFQLNDLTAAVLMTPRIILTFLKGDLTLAEAQNAIITSEHSRILIVQESIDQILGYCLKDELLTAIIEGNQEEKISNFVRSVHYVPEMIKADKLLKSFQDAREHLMVVLGEYGGVSGIVTLEDVLEVLTGEIVDETDRIVDLQQIAKKKRNVLLNARGIAEKSIDTSTNDIVNN
ncbi:hemolysin family protein [Crocosphaera sp. UHCC 0190]|uniref:hemolysin family protein n=1 Tax=Crocosphaera sp. UHCC 0190 TaxID=3110246 RepID=UPI002B20DC76|nr:hemolysin family protein [Crocosphaera sp. UHCC 0190]MEA5510287.1 hemolysin family protein [Crocosphaera sp. UHCC 0190]